MTSNEETKYHSHNGLKYTIQVPVSSWNRLESYLAIAKQMLSSPPNKYEYSIKYYSGIPSPMVTGLINKYQIKGFKPENGITLPVDNTDRDNIRHTEFLIRMPKVLESGIPFDQKYTQGKDIDYAEFTKQKDQNGLPIWYLYIELKKKVKIKPAPRNKFAKKKHPQKKSAKKKPRG